MEIKAIVLMEDAVNDGGKKKVQCQQFDLCLEAKAQKVGESIILSVCIPASLCEIIHEKEKRIMLKKILDI